MIGRVEGGSGGEAVMECGDRKHGGAGGVGGDIGWNGGLGVII